MRIRIEFHKFLNIARVESGSLIEVPEGCSVRDLYARLGIGKNRQGLILAFVNEEPAWKSTVLRDNDIVVLRITSGGG
jgi:sulfur carrier protein ThiS